MNIKDTKDKKHRTRKKEQEEERNKLVKIISKGKMQVRGSSYEIIISDRQTR